MIKKERTEEVEEESRERRWKANLFDQSTTDAKARTIGMMHQHELTDTTREIHRGEIRWDRPLNYSAKEMRWRPDGGGKGDGGRRKEEG